MFVPCTPIHNVPLLKVQRAVISPETNPKLLIYSTDGRITPMMVPDEGDISTAMGEKLKAYFVYSLEDGKIRLGREVYQRD